MAKTLSQELELFEKKKSWLLHNGNGKYVVIQGDKLLSFFNSEEEALREGYANFNPQKPFLIRQVSTKESVHSFSPSFGHHGIH